MDVLEYWRPSVDWSRFSRGPLTDHMWRLFCEHVELCHACMHWEEVARGQRLTPPPQSMYAERKYKNKRRRDEHKRELQRSERHRNRAALLVDEKIAEMSYLLSREGVTPDGKLCVSLRVALGYPSRGQWARCKIGAFTEFDASKELEGTVDKIADRWCRNAGFA